MKKLLGIVVLGLLCCNIGVAGHDARKKVVNASGGHVEKYGNPSLAKIARIANSNCQVYGAGKARNFVQLHKGSFFSTHSEYSSWNYDCQGETQSSASSGSTGDNITQAKQICKDLGFKTNTEKFADCSLKMLSMQFETKNRLALSGGGSQQQIIVRQGYDIGDAMIALSGIISDANNSRSSYGGGNCRIFQKAWGADMVCN